jgi:hypothetical protein
MQSKKSMHDGAPKEKVSAMLDTLLDTRPYQVMFKHYVVFAFMLGLRASWHGC